MDRVREGASYEVERSCLTLHWMVQPDMVEKCLENSDLMQSGFLARCLISIPHAEPAAAAWYPDPVDESASNAYGAAFRRLLETFHASGAVPVSVNVTHAAAVVFHGFDEACKARQRSTGDAKDIPAFAARWAENSMRVALVLHAMKHGTRATASPVSPQTAQNAVEIVGPMLFHTRQAPPDGIYDIYIYIYIYSLYVLCVLFIHKMVNGILESLFFVSLLHVLLHG